MPKKRRIPTEEEDPKDDESSHDASEDEESEDEKMVNSPEETPPSRENTSEGNIPFLDSFYGLASSSPEERSKSAHAMLTHCLLGPDANTKDAAYALRRLLNGICSGRAGARQGFSAALTSFLKIAVRTGALEQIQKASNEREKEEEGSDSDCTVLEFVRDELTRATDPTKAEGSKFGKRKGSEERDYQFGRLFGILSVVRSGILLPMDDETAGDTPTTTKVASGYASDLVELYHAKKWLREPASHGLISLLNSLYDACEKPSAKNVVDRVVRNVVIPLLLEGETKSFTEYSAEQLAVALTIQRNSSLHDAELPAPLCHAIFSSETLPSLARALGESSTVVHPRTHVVWDVVWSYLSERNDSGTASRRKRGQPVHLKLRDKCPVSEEHASKTVQALVQFVIEESLLALKSPEQETPSSNSTHERKALALSLVKILSGGERTLPNGTFLLDVGSDLLSRVVLKPLVVRRLFLDIICAGSGGGSKQGSHMLKPLALHVLESIVESNTNSESDGDTLLSRRLACAKSFLLCEPRFDGRTKTATVSSLLLLDELVVASESVFEMWFAYISFLEEQIASSSEEEDRTTTEKSASYAALGYVDLLFNGAKRFLRLQPSTEVSFEALQKFKDVVMMRILGFLMSSAFFDCSNLSGKRKKKKGKEVSPTDQPILAAGLRLAESLKNVEGSIPYTVRTVLSSRFFSLLAEYALVSTPKSKVDDEMSETKQEKDVRIFELLVDLCRGRELLQERGAKSYGNEPAGDSDRLVAEMQKSAKKYVEENETSSKGNKRFAVGCSILATSLHLHLLTCGSPDSIDESDTDEEDESDIQELISDVNTVVSDVLGSRELDEDGGDATNNPLLGLTELCVNVLSSALFSKTQTRGASLKLIREVVKHTWTGGLMTIAANSPESMKEPMLNIEVLQVLLDAIGAPMEDEREDEADHEMSDEGSGESSDEGVFSECAAKALGVDDDDENDDEEDRKVERDQNHADAPMDEEDDVEINADQFQTMLMEESDTEMSNAGEEGLEHHAGADAALAKLIKMRQDARKAGRLARERIELANQLRCIPLVEILLSNPGRAWSTLLPPESVLNMFCPLLLARRSIERALTSNSSTGLSKKHGASDNDKRALLDKITSLLKTKLCKIKFTRKTDSDFVGGLASNLMDETRKTDSSEHASCCSAALLAVLRSISENQKIVATADVYSNALSEWATKRNTRIRASLFEDLIQQMPELAQVKLAAPLAEHAKIARSPFLKSECFRLLTTLFSRVTSSEELNDIGKRGLLSLRESSGQLSLGIIDALGDDDMKKAKRARDVLKAASSLVAFLKLTSAVDLSTRNELQRMKQTLATFKSESESSAVSAMCEKLIAELDDVAVEVMDIETDSPNKKTGKKKKKKRKRKE